MSASIYVYSDDGLKGDQLEFSNIAFESHVYGDCALYYAIIQVRKVFRKIAKDDQKNVPNTVTYSD